MEAARGEVVLVSKLSPVMVLTVMLADVMVSMVRLLVLLQMHVPIPLMILRSVQQTMLTLISILGVHVEAVADGMVHGRP